MLTIGEFSLATRLSVKTLRYYHDEGLLVPDYIDEDSGYRYYREVSAEKAALIAMLREMNFTIADIKEILARCTDDSHVLETLTAHREKIVEIINGYRTISDNLDQMIGQIRRNEMNQKKMNIAIQEKFIDDIIFAGRRFKGRYDEVGKIFSLVGRKMGRHIAGKPMALYYDGEYCDHNADIEAGFPVSKSVSDDEIVCRVLPGGRAITIIHRGPYDDLGNSYRRILSNVEEKKLRIKLPTREVYLKGPGILFRGNPDNYLTEIQIFLED